MNSYKTQNIALAAGLLCVLAPTSGFAAGFQINEHSASATGRASSVVATVNTPAAILHNPAGLTKLKGTQFEAGVTFVKSAATYTGTGLPSTNPSGATVSQSTDNGIAPVPNAYISHQLSDKANLGFGFYMPYGLKVAWDDPENFVGRTINQEIGLRTFFLSPTMALKLSDRISFAVGVSLVPATVYLKRTLGASDNNQVLFPTSTYSSEATLELAGSAFGVGANAGLMVDLPADLVLGVAYRSAIDLAFSGDANFDLPVEASPEVQANFPDGTGTADLTLPHALNFGLGYIGKALTLEASAQVTFWQSYDELRLNFESGLPTPTSAAPRNWHASTLLRLGGQYDIDKLALRAGAAYDFTPIPDNTVDPTLPGSDRLFFTLGSGYDFGSFRADIAYMGLMLQKREITESITFAPGTYETSWIHLLSTSIGVKI